MSQQFAAAATTASSFEQAIVSGIGQVGTPRLAAGIATDIDTLEQGFAAIASDLADGSLELAHGPGVCAVALFELANSIPQVDPVLIACQQPLLDASQAMVTMSTIADPNLTEAEAQVIYETMFEFYQNMQLVAESLMPAFDAAIPASAPTATSSGLCPPSHPFKGCTTYQKTTYVPPPFCGGWVHLAGGISVPGITILPDSGLWVRTCWWVTQTTIKEVCECYGSRWDRLWAIGGTNKVITTSPHPTFGTDSTTDYDITGLTAPSSSAPGTPSPDVKVL